MHYIQIVKFIILSSVQSLSNLMVSDRLFFELIGRRLNWLMEKEEKRESRKEGVLEHSFLKFFPSENMIKTVQSRLVLLYGAVY